MHITSIPAMLAAGVTAAVLALAGTTPVNASPGPGGSNGDVSEAGTHQVGVQQTSLPDPDVTSNRGTARSYSFGGGTVEVRYGTYQGTQYGWGRAINTNSNYYIRFEVDLDGDRVRDWSSTYRISTRNYTTGYATSSSPNRAFRACIITDPAARCRPAGTTTLPRNSTTWW
jgi:hypothetical protein